MRKTILLVLLVVSVNTFAGISVTIGQTFPVAEMDFRQYVFFKLNKMKQSGELEKIKKEAINRVANSALRPKPLNLETQDKSLTYFVSAEQVVEKDIFLPDGRLLVKKGTKINPFHRVSLPYVMIFIDGDDDQQVLWAKSYVTKIGANKIILTGGNVKEASKIFSHIYFDQEGKITKKLNITHVPSVASQSSDKWKIEVIGRKEFKHA